MLVWQVWIKMEQATQGRAVGRRHDGRWWKDRANKRLGQAERQNDQLLGYVSNGDAVLRTKRNVISATASLVAHEKDGRRLV